MKKSTVTRTDLLTVHLHDKQSLSKVEIKKIVIPQKGKADYHLHSCPVVGYVVSGTLLFQIEGQSSYLIKASFGFVAVVCRRCVMARNTGVSAAFCAEGLHL